jgi:hypothetical protein
MQFPPAWCYSQGCFLRFTYGCNGDPRVRQDRSSCVDCAARFIARAQAALSTPPDVHYVRMLMCYDTFLSLQIASLQRAIYAAW